MTPLKFTIAGEPASKANSRRLVTNARTGKPMSIKSSKATRYAFTAALQTPAQEPLLEGPLAVTMRIYYASERPDLDPSIILDALQGRIYANDRAVRELHLFHHIDRANPRAEIEIEARK